MARSEIREVKMDLIDILTVLRGPEEYDESRTTKKFIEDLSSEIHGLDITNQITTLDFIQVIEASRLKLGSTTAKRFIAGNLLPKLVLKIGSYKGANAKAFALEIAKFVSSLPENIEQRQ
jgi:hypothetical protein